MSNAAGVKNVRIDGSGFEAAICAAFLAWAGKLIGFQVYGDITTASGDAPVIAGPRSLDLFRKMGLSERDLIKACAGTFVCGAKISTPNENAPGFYPFITNAPVTDGVALNQIYNAAKSTNFHYADLFAPTHMARTGAFSHPVEGDAYRYSLVLDAAQLEDYLMRAAHHYGFRDQAQNQAKVKEDDLIFKVSAPNREDRAEVTVKPDVSMPSCMSHEISAKGKLNHIANTQTHSFTSTYSVSPTHATSHQIQVWQDRVINPSGALEVLLPLDHCYLDALSHMLLTLFDIWPSSLDFGLIRREFNRRSESFCARASDYQNTPFLAAKVVLNEAVSSEMQVKWRQFMARGRLVSYDDEPVSDAEWTAYFLALDLKPERTDPLAGKFSATQISQILSRCRDAAQIRAAELTPQSEYLDRASALHHLEKVTA